MNASSPDDFKYLGFNLTPAEAEIAESMLAVMHGPTYGALFDLGIHGNAITGRYGDPFDALHLESVVYLPGGRFELARDMRDQSDSRLAIIIPCRNEFGLVDDLAAWNTQTGKLAHWHGAAALLGEIYLTEPWVDDGVRVFATAAEWLRADRRGVVVLRASLARWRLAEYRLIVNDADFGRKLRNALRLPEPSIYVDVRRAAA